MNPYWREAPSGLVVPNHVDTTGFDRTCVAPGPLGDPGQPGRRREPNLLGFIPMPGNPLGWLTVYDDLGRRDPESRRRPAIGILRPCNTCSAYDAKSTITTVLSTGGVCT